MLANRQAMELLSLMAGVLFAVTMSTVGDILLAVGMKKVGAVQWTGWRGALATAGRVVRTPQILSAIVCMAVFFFSWLALLSRADLSLILPLTAVTYILNGLAAGPVLGEKVSRRRWLGILVIAAGVVLVTLSGGNEH